MNQLKKEPIRKRMHRNMKESQKEQMIKFLDEHPRLKEGRCDRNFTTEDARRLWQKMANILNAMEGPKKSWLYWRKSYADLRCWQRRTGKQILVKRKIIPIPSDEGDAAGGQFGRVAKKSPQSENNDVVCHMIGETFIKKIPPVRSSTSPSVQSTARVQSSSTTSSSPKPRLAAHRKQIPDSAVKIEDADSIAFVDANNLPDDHVEHEYYRKKLELLERLSMAFETQAQSIQIQADAFLELNETMKKIQETLNKIANRIP
ncbi:uncharacterized protein LOC129786711 [Lutzomyia longipalpis]|uniref:uncharacterized protein LOC129786711 n=1 Tax=Lutzomyia longipalpis TaxID=7200 RepID=UPI00248400DF|nr:uncharacterized protein LOC129786711 [Lutzomyia longipalpis]